MEGNTTGGSEAVCALCQSSIKENTLFTGLTGDQLEAFKDVMLFVPRRRREVIFLAGDPCGGLYVIRTGRVKLVRSSRAGKEQILKILGPGDLLGFEVFYNGLNYANTAVAMDCAELYYIGKEDFFKILEAHPAVLRQLITSMGVELKLAYERIGDLGLFNAREKLARLLHTLASDYGVAEDGGVRLHLTLSRLEIAELLGITQETSIRLLKGFGEDGVIEIRKKDIFIKSLERLKRLGQ
jgi:CRP-like cAMP-binding protein